MITGLVGVQAHKQITVKLCGNGCRKERQYRQDQGENRTKPEILCTERREKE